MGNRFYQLRRVKDHMSWRPDSMTCRKTLIKFLENIASVNLQITDKFFNSQQSLDHVHKCFQHSYNGIL